MADNDSSAIATICGLFTHPIKGARPVALQSALMTKTGLRFDREWMIVNADTGKFISQREIPKLSLVVPELPAEVLNNPTAALAADSCITINAPGMPEPLRIPLSLDVSQLRLVNVWEWTGQAMDAGDAAAEWFTKCLGKPCRLVRYVGTRMAGQIDPAAANGALNRLTDAEFAQGYETSLTDGFPLLLANEASLTDINTRLAESVASGQSDIELPLTMTRFRPNLVVRGLEPWAEDKWRTLRVEAAAGLQPGETGPVEFTSVKPCARCKVPTINPLTAVESEGEPLDILSTFRKGSHLSWTIKSWKHAVHFGWNLVPAPQAAGRVLSVGDTVEFTGTQKSW